MRSSTGILGPFTTPLGLESPPQGLGPHSQITQERQYTNVDVYPNMGGRLSTARGPGGTTEASNLTRYSRRRPLNYRLILGPLGVLTLSALFWVYSRTSIRAAKENARRHREADGGSISWRNEALRRHGALAKPETRTLMQELFSSGKQDEEQTRRDRSTVQARPKEVNAIEEGIRKAREGKTMRRKVNDGEDE